MKETIAYLNSLLNEGDKVVIGLSGGPDSMCLLHLLKNCNKNIDIICAHINHNIRKESAEEAVFIEEYCKKEHLKLETICFEKKSSVNNYSEQELREKRYEYFASVIKKYNAAYLFTAHHGDDLMETILMRLTRGSNLKGYSGFSIETKKENYKIIRPLVFTTKEEIEKYNEENHISYVIDKSNFSEEYTRNRYRKTILPFLKKENKNVHLKYLKFSKELLTYYNYVDDLITQEFNKRYKDGILNIKNYKKLDILLQTKIIEQVLNKQYVDNLFLVSDKHITLILDVIKSNKPNIEINLPGKWKVIKTYDSLKITHETKHKQEYQVKLIDNLELPNGYKIKYLKESNDNSNNCICLNSEEISFPLYVRTRKNGDKMIIKNMKSPKKIKDIFIDSKMTKEKREIQPILVDSNDTILWLPGLKKSKFAKANTENYDIILWYN